MFRVFWSSDSHLGRKARVFIANPAIGVRLEASLIASRSLVEPLTAPKLSGEVDCFTLAGAGVRLSMMMGSGPSGARSTTESNDTSSLARVRSKPYVTSLQRVSMSTKLKQSLEGNVLQRRGHTKYRLRVVRC
jgi:hypothetical protein